MNEQSKEAGPQLSAGQKIAVLQESIRTIEEQSKAVDHQELTMGQRIEVLRIVYGAMGDNKAYAPSYAAKHYLAAIELLVRNTYSGSPWDPNPKPLDPDYGKSD